MAERLGRPRFAAGETENLTFFPEEYATVPCPYPIGSEERLSVQQLRAERCIPIQIEGDNDSCLDQTVAVRCGSPLESYTGILAARRGALQIATTEM